MQHYDDTVGSKNFKELCKYYYKIFGVDFMNLHYDRNLPKNAKNVIVFIGTYKE
jgi:hypothetical protein